MSSKGVAIPRRMISDFITEKTAKAKIMAECGRKYKNDLSSKIREVVVETYRIIFGALIRLTKTAEVEKTFLNKLKFSNVGVEQLVENISNLTLQTYATTSFYLGRWPYRIGGRPYNVAFPRTRTLLYFLNNELIRLFGLKDPDSFILTCGSFHTNGHQFQQVISSGKDEVPFTYEDFLKFKPLVYKFVSKMKVADMGDVHFDDVLDSHFPTGTYAGRRWNDFFKITTKEKGAGHIIYAARKLWDRVIQKKGSQRLNSLWSVGGREKKDNTEPDPTIATSRGVHMPEAHIELLMVPFAKRVEMYLKTRRSHPIYLGFSTSNGGWQRLEKDLNFSTLVVEGDWKRFDTTLKEDRLFLAFSLWRSFFPSDKKYDYLFLAFAEQALFKNYVIPGGFIYSILGGMPSGSRVTALINTFVNFWLLTEIAGHFWPHLPPGALRFAIGGDDFLIFIRGPTAGTPAESQSLIDDIISFSSQKFRMNLKVTSKITENFPSDPLLCPSFYKYIIYKGHVTIRPDHLYERLIISQQGHKKKLSDYENLLTHFGSPVYPFEWFSWLFDLLSIYSPSNDKPEIYKKKYLELYLERILPMHSEDLSGVDGHPVPFRNFNYRLSEEDKKKVLDLICEWSPKQTWKGGKFQKFCQSRDDLRDKLKDKEPKFFSA